MNPTYTLAARTLLAIMFVAFYGYIVLVVIGRESEFLPGVKDVAMFLLGALTTSVVTVVGFFFNSSQGSSTSRPTQTDVPPSVEEQGTGWSSTKVPPRQELRCKTWRAPTL